MIIYCQFKPESLYNSLHELIRSAFPGVEIKLEFGGHADTAFQIEMEEYKDSVMVKGAILAPEGNVIKREEYTYKSQGEERANEARWFARRFTYNLLAEFLERNISNYGILTGVRPMKLVHRFMDRGQSNEDITLALQKDYYLSPDKARLLLEIANFNRQYLLTAEEARKCISIYIGIPYCPSKCYYCSFPGAVLKDYQRDIPPFMSALEQEMKAIAHILQEKRLKVQTIYIGGGTPTVLSAGDLSRIFNILHSKYCSNDTTEITVEAGRPDTLSPEKLKLLKDAGVNRICVNPQTMNNSTLELIGRNHDKEGVVQSIEWVREAGIKKINMDLIVGLPTEGLKENEYTAEEILKIRPENITVHTLALKKGSRMADMENRENIGDRIDEVKKGVEYFSSVFRNREYIPYYLYRQKYMKAGMENIGYTLPAHTCVYNVQMIEEKQTIIGMGGGAASKFLNAENWTLTSFYNPKNPATYCESVAKLIQCKVDKLQALN